MSDIEIRPLGTPEQLRTVSAVYRRAFGYADNEAGIPAKLLWTLAQHGGIVLGAFAEPAAALVGFCYGFLARDPAHPELYLFSQTAAVLPEYQSSGVGTRLKWAQREHALAAGLGVIRWTFDPMRTRNAHVNFDSLGASSNTLLPEYYGVDTTGRDAGTGSDRLLVDWPLTAVTPPDPAHPHHSAVSPPPGFSAAPGTRDGEWLAVPADWDAYRATVPAEQAHQVRLAVRAELAGAFAAGQRLISSQRVSPDLCGYRLV